MYTGAAGLLLLPFPGALPLADWFFESSPACAATAAVHEAIDAAVVGIM